VGFYHLLSADQRSLSLQAWSTRTVEVFCSAQGSGRHYSLDEAGVWVDCVRQRGPVVHNDYATLPHKKGLPEGHAPVLRELVVPILRDGRIVAILGVGNKATDYTDEDVSTVTYLADIAWEIARRKQAEEALRAEEEKYRLITDNTLDIIWTMGLDLVFRYVNPAVTRVTGYAPEQWIGTELAEHLEPSEFDRLKEMLATELAQGPSDHGVAFETRLRRADGREVPVEVHAKLVCDEKGAPNQIQGVTLDITQRQELQARLAQADRLQTMGTLAAGIAHEINNPLAYVLHNIESLAGDLPRLVEILRRCHATLRSRGDSPTIDALLGGEASFELARFDDVAARFRDALSGAVRIKEIVRGLNTFSRIERPELAPVEVHLAVEQAIDMAFNEIRFRARLVKDFGELPLVLGSDGRLVQVFLNLLINAAHAIDEGHVADNEIRIRTWAEGDQVFVAVSDTGKGILPEHQTKVFETFFTTKGVGVGTGLGLSICRNLITELGGEISFTSEVGRGTCFLVRLPRAPVAPGRQGQDTPAPAPARAGIRGRILVVDDEAGMRAILVNLLGREHEVIVLASGEEALALLEQDRRFDLIFCDLMMPRLSGVELHTWLAERDPELAAQVVFITGGAFTPGVAAYLRRVGNLRIEKPFETTAFKRTADELLHAAQAKRRT